MNSNSITTALIAASLCTVGTAWYRWQRAVPHVVPDRASVVALRKAGAAVSDSALSDAEDFTVTNDPFRLSNTPPSVRYDPAADGAVSGLGAQIAPLVRPIFVLKGIVGGPPWQAIIDGIPGQPPGTIARQGSKYDKITVRAVTRDSVIVQGPDTAWVLSFRGRT